MPSVLILGTWLLYSLIPGFGYRSFLYYRARVSAILSLLLHTQPHLAVWCLFFVSVPPKIHCPPVSAYVGERDVRLTCEVRAKPSVTSLFWIVDNGTTLSDHDMVDGYQFTVKVRVLHMYSVYSLYVCAAVCK